MDTNKSKVQAAQFLNRTGLPQYLISRSRWRIILAFHRVISDSRARELGLHPTMYITPGSFRTLLFSMKKIGAFLDIYDLLAAIPSRTSFSVTFDDGWIDTYTTAFPILKELGIPFSLFIPTLLIDNGHMNWTEDIISQYFRVAKDEPKKAAAALSMLADKNVSYQSDIHGLIERLKELPYTDRKDHIEAFYKELDSKTPINGEMLSWLQVKELNNTGVVIGSHTHSHSILSYLNKEEVIEELQRSKEIIRERLSYDPDIFCYPNGRYKREHEDVIRSLGYHYGLILDDKRVHQDDSPFFIPRFLVCESNLPLLYFRFLTEYKRGESGQARKADND